MADTPDDFAKAVRDDLDRRLAELEAAPDAFGELGRAEWGLAWVGCVVIPLAIVWAFA